MFPANINLGTLNGVNGFSLTGENIGDASGYSVSDAGDINCDGCADLIIGAPGGQGGSYVVFGCPMGGFPANVTLGSLTGTNGFSLTGENIGDSAGYSVNGAGDVNGDGCADLIIGACTYPGNGQGRSYVVFGCPVGGFPANISLGSLTGTNGFSITGENINDFSGWAVSGAGDVNCDGCADLVIGAPFYPGVAQGRSYVVFGCPVGGFPANITLGSLTATNGFSLTGENIGDSAGYSVSGAGDVNGDSCADLIIGAYAYPANSVQGRSYVVFGCPAGGFPANIALGTLPGTNGFSITGENINDFSGWAVSGAGDVNCDGCADLVIGAPFYPGVAQGRSYVVFGCPVGGFPVNITLGTLTGTNGFSLTGENNSDFSGYSVSGAGDVNGDGSADLIIGAYGYPVYNQQGRSYVVFGICPPSNSSSTSISGSVTGSNSWSNSNSLTVSVSSSNSGTGSSSRSTSISGSVTDSNSWSNSNSLTASVSSSNSGAGSSSRSASTTGSTSNSNSVTPSVSGSYSNSESTTSSVTASTTGSVSKSLSGPSSSTGSLTGSSSGSRSASSSATGSFTASVSTTESVSGSSSGTMSNTGSLTGSSSGSRSASSSATGSFTGSISATESSSSSKSVSVTVSTGPIETIFPSVASGSISRETVSPSEALSGSSSTIFYNSNRPSENPSLEPLASGQSTGSPSNAPSLSQGLSHSASGSLGLSVQGSLRGTASLTTHGTGSVSLGSTASVSIAPTGSLSKAFSKSNSISSKGTRTASAFGRETGSPVNGGRVIPIELSLGFLKRYESSKASALNTVSSSSMVSRVPDQPSITSERPDESASANPVRSVTASGPGERSTAFPLSISRAQETSSSIIGRSVRPSKEGNSVSVAPRSQVVQETSMLGRSVRASSEGIIASALVRSSIGQGTSESRTASTAIGKGSQSASESRGVIESGQLQSSNAVGGTSRSERPLQTASRTLAQVIATRTHGHLTLSSSESFVRPASHSATSDRGSDKTRSASRQMGAESVSVKALASKSHSHTEDLHLKTPSATREGSLSRTSSVEGAEKSAKATQPPQIYRRSKGRREGGQDSESSQKAHRHGGSEGREVSGKSSESSRQKRSLSERSIRQAELPAAKKEVNENKNKGNLNANNVRKSSVENRNEPNEVTNNRNRHSNQDNNNNNDNINHRKQSSSRHSSSQYPSFLEPQDFGYGSSSSAGSRLEPGWMQPITAAANLMVTGGQALGNRLAHALPALGDGISRTQETDFEYGREAENFEGSSATFPSFDAGQVALGAVAIHLANKAYEGIKSWWNGVPVEMQVSDERVVEKEFKAYLGKSGRVIEQLTDLFTNVKAKIEAAQQPVEWLEEALEAHAFEHRWLERQGYATKDQLAQLNSHLRAVAEGIADLGYTVDIPIKVCFQVNKELKAVYEQLKGLERGTSEPRNEGKPLTFESESLPARKPRSLQWLETGNPGSSSSLLALSQPEPTLAGASVNVSHWLRA